MIHFFPTFSKDADGTALGEELRRQRVEYRIFATSIRIHFRTRIMILLVAYPKLAWFALKSAWRSMVLSRPGPDAVVVGSDVEVLVFAALRMLLPGRRPRIVLQSFIYTFRRTSAVNRLRTIYYRFILARCACIVCHSRLELDRYGAIFPRSKGRFAFVPWGGAVNIDQRPTDAADATRLLRVLAAGRSGRDYPTLVRAAATSPVEVTIVCDSLGALNGVTGAPGIRVLRGCYDDAFHAELERADVVAVPLAIDDISAGQMVMVQAMAYGKPVVITRTPTVSDYLDDDVEGLLVRRGDAEDLARALGRLHRDPMLRRRLGKAARATYEARFSQGAYVRNVVAAIAACCKVPA